MVEPGPVRTDPLARLLPVALRLDGPPAAEGTGRDLHGAVLFADLSGFTPLTERLAATGTEGVEVLSTFLNGLFATLIDAVVEGGGDVWVLAGDAIVALWPDGDEPGSAVRAAVSAGLVALARARGLRSPDGAEVGIRASVSWGALRIDLQGDPSRPVPILSGPAVSEIGRVDRAGSVGQVTVGPSAAPHLGRAHIEPAADGCVCVRGLGPADGTRIAAGPARPLLSVHGIETVPTAIAALARADSGAWASEYRELTAVFVDLSPALELSSARRGAAIAGLQGLVASHGAALDRLVVDDKGLVLVALFGVPGHRHADDAVRAVRAARAMLDHLDAVGIAGRAGVATGPAFCALVGSSARTQYTAIGEVMNRAARLMATADADAPLLVGERVQRAAADRFAFEPAAARVVKGIAEPLRPFVPVGGTVRAPARPAFFAGRSEEQELLRSAWRAVSSDGRTRLVVIEGEAGMGKTALVAMAAGEWSADPATVVHRGEATPSEAATAYQLWRGVASSVLGLGADPSVEEIGAVVDADQRLVDDDRPLLGVLFGRRTGAAEIRPDAVAEAMADLFGRLLARGEGTTVVIVLEDGHWSDSASWTLYRNLARRCPQLLMVLTCRPDDLDHRLPGAHPVEVPLTSVTMGPLPAAVTAEVAAAAIGAERLAPRMAGVIAERTQGHPLFAQELARSLRDAGLVEVDHGTARLRSSATDLDAAAIPPTVEGVLAARIDRLAPHQQRTAKAAATIGRTLDLARLRVLVDDLPVDDLAEELVEAELLTPLGEGPGGGAYEFRHALVRDAAYGLMSFEQRRALNAALARWYEQSAEDPAPERLAHHWSEADEPGRAVPYAVAAGHRSLDAAAYAEGAAQFGRAIELAGHARASAPAAAELASWHERLGFARHSLGALDEAEAAHRRALALLDRPFPADRGLAVRLAREALRQAGHRVRPALRPSRVRQRQRQAEVEVATRSREGLIQVFYMVEDPIRSSYGILALVNEAERAAPTPELARGLASMSTLCCFAGLGRYADRYRDLAVQLTEELDDPAATAASAIYLGLYAGTVGRWDEAIAQLSAAAAGFADLGEPRRVLEASSLLGNAYLAVGDLDRAEELFARVHEGAIRIEHRWLEGAGLIELAMVALRRDEVERAVALTTEADGLGDSIGRSTAIWGGGLRALAQVRAGDQDRARRSAAATLELCAGVRPAAAFAMEGYAALIEAVRAPGMGSSAAQQRAALAQLRTLARAAPAAVPRYRYLLGLAARDAGRHRQARRHLEAALDRAQALGMPHDAALAAAALGVTG